MLSIVFELIVQVIWPFQFTSGDGSSAVVSVVGRLTLAPRPATSYLSHSTKPSALTLGDTAHVSLFIVRGSFCVVELPVYPAGLVASSRYWKPEEKNNVSFLEGPPICAHVSTQWPIWSGVNFARRASESDVVLSATHLFDSIRYSPRPVNLLLPERIMLLAATPVNSPYSALAPSETTCTCSTQL